MLPVEGLRCSVKVKVTHSCLTLCDSMDYTVHGILQARILEWVAFPSWGKDPSWVGLLNPGLPHCRQILYQLSHKGSPRILEWIACPFSRGSSQLWMEPGSPAGGCIKHGSCLCVSRFHWGAKTHGMPTIVRASWCWVVQKREQAIDEVFSWRGSHKTNAAGKLS